MNVGTELALEDRSEMFSHVQSLLSFLITCFAFIAAYVKEHREVSSN